MKRIILLGATGSIGRSTIDVIRANPDRFDLVGLSAHTNAFELETLASEFGVQHAVLSGVESDLPSAERDTPEPDRLDAMIRSMDADIVVNGISGAAGLAPSIATLESGMDLALANKETIVMAGELIRKLARQNQRSIIPVDSEHAGLFYLLENLPKRNVSRLVLTASGGAFRDVPIEELDSATVADALSHPTWNMGAKITIDSATMINKGLEIIEAVQFFDTPESSIDVYIHRESTVHALVQTIEGSYYAQLSEPDMRVPIQHALSYPDELPCEWGNLDLSNLVLSFQTPDPAKYPALDLARGAVRRGGAYTVAFNAANEIAVSAFIEGRLGYTRIPHVIDRCLSADWESPMRSFEQIYDSDNRARMLAESYIVSLGGHS